MRRRFAPSGALRGTVTPPPDKSISHRAALFAAMTDEPVTITNYLDADDTRSTLDALTSLGAAVDSIEGAQVVRGVGLRTAAEATGGMLNVGNAGTLMRLPRVGSPGSPAATGRSTATSRSGAGRWTGSPPRFGAWARASSSTTTASHR